MTFNQSLFSSVDHSWGTPDYLFERLDEEFRFDLDPCCSVETARCSKYFTTEDDGLSKRWHGSVFMNPPYGRQIKLWVKKAFESSAQGCTVVCLLPARTDTVWWHSYVMQSAEIRLATKRLEFKGSSNKAPFPVAVVVFKPDDHRAVLTSVDTSKPTAEREG